jgi:hypothetical protein
MTSQHPPQATARTRQDQSQTALNELHQSIEAHLQLAKLAETWEWKEVQAEQS